MSAGGGYFDHAQALRVLIAQCVRKTGEVGNAVLGTVGPAEALDTDVLWRAIDAFKGGCVWGLFVLGCALLEEFEDAPALVVDDDQGEVSCCGS